MAKRCWQIGALALAILCSIPAVSPAFEPAENDAFYLGLGSSNIEVENSDGLLEGHNVLGGVRVGLFLTFFLELGYGTIRYSDNVLVKDPITGTSTRENINFRTTGPHFGLGFLIPIRKILLGAKFHRSPSNRWSEERTDADLGTTIDRISGRIDFDSYFVFTRLGEKGIYEFGVRRDRIKTTDSVLTNSFGPYFMLNIPLN